MVLACRRWGSACPGSDVRGNLTCMNPSAMMPMLLVVLTQCNGQSLQPDSKKSGISHSRRYWILTFASTMFIFQIGLILIICCADPWDEHWTDAWSWWYIFFVSNMLFLLLAYHDWRFLLCDSLIHLWAWRSVNVIHKFVQAQVNPFSSGRFSYKILCLPWFLDW